VDAVVPAGGGDHYRCRCAAIPRGDCSAGVGYSGCRRDRGSQHDGFAFDLWLTDARTGKVRKRLVGSARDAGLESLRYMNSGASFSADGRYIAFAAKDGGQDALYVYDMQRSRMTRKLKFDLNGVSAPSWSPDGSRIVFTGLDGGISDLFVTDLAGNLSRLTDDRYADLLPAWSPDGSRIAFTTDRSGTDLDMLVYGNTRIAVMDIATRRIDVLPHQDEGKNINPVWSPDGSSLIWVSDRADHLVNFGLGVLQHFGRRAKT
jgi:dipeptidyl aminopeptidase/acylaminoacyl peptidase